MNMVSREEAINLILTVTKPEDLVIACNGKLGRELYELRAERGEPQEDFILVGAMGCALGVAIGVAMNTDKKVVCLLGDGNFLMKMGSLATYEQLDLDNLYVYILNNNCHDSTGGQGTAFSKIRERLPHRFNFRIIDVARGARANLGRPKVSPGEMTRRFQEKCLSLI